VLTSNSYPKAINVKAFIITAVMLISAGLCDDSVARPSVDTLTREVEESLHSDILGEDVAMSVYLPASYGRGDNSYPTLYVLEHDLYYRCLTGIVETYTRLGTIPEMIVIGVASNDRWRDFTPTRAAIPDGRAIPNSGGSSSYRNFIIEEAVSCIDERYRTQPFSVLYGHSIAGLFAVESMISGDDAFDAYIATSPSLWWDDEIVTTWMKRSLLSDSTFSSCLFLALGNEGETMQVPVERYRDMLEEHASKNFHWDYRHFGDAEHQVMPVKSFTYALEYVFSDWRMPDSIVTMGFQSVVEYYAELSKRYGYRIGVPERITNRIGYMELKKGNVDKAIEIFEMNVGEFPNSANVYDSLAEAYFEKGDVERALRYYERALELDPGNRNAGEMIDRLKAR
jgi:predicted alpha/beta superfamily hydrolase